MRNYEGQIKARAVGRERACLSLRSASTQLTPIGRNSAGVIGLFFIMVSWFATSSSIDQAAATAHTQSTPCPETIALAFSPDGKTLATTHTDQRVALRAVSDGLPVMHQIESREHVWAIAYSPDGKWLALGGAGADIIACELGPTGRERLLGIPIRMTTAVAMTPDGQTLVATSDVTSEIVVWDLKRRTAKMTLRGHSSPPTAMALSPDGRSLASAEKMMPAILIWDLGTGLARLKLPAPGRRRVLSFSHDGAWIAAAGVGGHRARVWNSATGEERRLITPGSDACMGATFSADGRLIATTGHDGSVRLWDVASGEERQCLACKEPLLLDLVFAPDSKTLAARGFTTGLLRWDLTPRAPAN